MAQPPIHSTNLGPESEYAPCDLAAGDDIADGGAADALDVDDDQDDVDRNGHRGHHHDGVAAAAHGGEAGQQQFTLEGAQGGKIIHTGLHDYSFSIFDT